MPISSFFIYILLSILMQCVLTITTLKTACTILAGSFFDTPDPALIIVGRKSIIEGEKLNLSAGKHH
jgi:hypothetical protein